MTRSRAGNSDVLLLHPFHRLGLGFAAWKGPWRRALIKGVDVGEAKGAGQSRAGLTAFGTPSPFLHDSVAARSAKLKTPLLAPASLSMRFAAENRTATLSGHFASERRRSSAT